MTFYSSQAGLIAASVLQKTQDQYSSKKPCPQLLQHQIDTKVVAESDKRTASSEIARTRWSPFNSRYKGVDQLVRYLPTAWRLSFGEKEAHEAFFLYWRRCRSFLGLSSCAQCWLRLIAHLSFCSAAQCQWSGVVAADEQLPVETDLPSTFLCKVWVRSCTEQFRMKHEPYYFFSKNARKRNGRGFAKAAAAFWLDKSWGGMCHCDTKRGTCDCSYSAGVKTNWFNLSITAFLSLILS